MYSAKFYHQSSFGPHLMSPFYSLGALLRTPKRQDVTRNNDVFLRANPSKFEIVLHEKMKYLLEKESALKKKIPTDLKEISEKERLKLSLENQRLEVARKWIAFIIDHMQKCMLAIVANFR